MDEEREGVWGYPGMPGWGVYFCVRILQCLFLLHVCRVTVDLMRVAVWACCLCLAWACYHDVFCSTVRAAWCFLWSLSFSLGLLWGSPATGTQARPSTGKREQSVQAGSCCSEPVFIHVMFICRVRSPNFKTGWVWLRAARACAKG